MAAAGIMVRVSPRRVPRLVPKPPSRALRALGYVLPGVRAVTDQIEPYTAWWDAQNQRVVDGSGPLLVAIGDSTALGIGASAPEHSYVGLLHAALTARAGDAGDQGSWRVVNLGLSGARLQDALDRQLPILHDLAERGPRPDAVVCCVGANDLAWGRDVAKLGAKLTTLATSLPAGAVVGTLSGASARGRLANRSLRTVADGHDLELVDTWSEPNPGRGSRVAADRFHPNDLGYRLMVRPFARAFDVAHHLEPLTDEVPASESGGR